MMITEGEKKKSFEILHAENHAIKRTKKKQRFTCLKILRVRKEINLFIVCVTR